MMNSKGNISVTFALILVMFMLFTGLLLWVSIGPVNDELYNVTHANEDVMTDSNLNSFDIIYGIYQHPLLALLFTCLIFVIVVATRSSDPNQEDEY